MTTLCDNMDYRAVSPSNQVARKVVTVIILNTASAGSATASIIGRILTVVADVPNLTGAGTLAIDIKDEDGTAVFAQKAAIAENQKSVVQYQAAATPHGAIVNGTVTFTCTASAGAQTGNQTINLIIYYI